MKSNTIETATGKELLLEVIKTGNQKLYKDDEQVFRTIDAWKIALSLEKEIQQTSQYVGIACYSPFLIFSLLLASWYNGKVPILLDPLLKSELEYFNNDDKMVFFTDTKKFKYRNNVFLNQNGFQINSKNNEWLQNIKYIPKFQFPADEAIFLGFFTSGSEGKSQIVFKKTRQIIGELETLHQLVHLKENCITLSFVPSFHIYGLLFAEFLPLMSKGITFSVAGKLLVNLSDTIKTLAPDFIVASPIHYEMLIKNLPDSIPNAKYISSGAPLSDDFADEFFAVTNQKIIQFYGSTETGGIASRLGSNVWKPMPCVAVQFKGDEGKIIVKSSWGSFDKALLWQETHDSGEICKGGFKLNGRLSNLLKYRGKRFSSLEIEKELSQYSEVKEALVLTYNSDGKENLIALLVMNNGAHINKASITQFLQQRLAPFKVPRSFRVVPKLPKRKMGKIDYSAIKKMLPGLFHGNL